MKPTWYSARTALGFNECGMLDRTEIFRAIWIKPVIQVSCRNWGEGCGWVSCDSGWCRLRLKGISMLEKKNGETTKNMW